MCIRDRVNPLPALCAAAQQAGLSVIVDAMSSFGAIPIPLGELGIDFLVTSPNKCLQGVPGCGLVIARRNALPSGRVHSLSPVSYTHLDVYKRQLDDPACTPGFLPASRRAR